jgi:hypothetical protein
MGCAQSTQISPAPLDKYAQMLQKYEELKMLNKSIEGERYAQEAMLAPVLNMFEENILLKVSLAEEYLHDLSEFYSSDLFEEATCYAAQIEVIRRSSSDCGCETNNLEYGIEDAKDYTETTDIRASKEYVDEVRSL